MQLNLKRSTSPDIVVRSEPTAVDRTTGRSDYLERNRDAWSRWAARSAAKGAEGWRTDQLRWGMWMSAESELGLLTQLAPGADIVELGCGSGALCGWFMRAGFRPVGIDFAPLQLAAAERLQQEHSLPFWLVQANAESVPFDRDSFDLAVSEYGASLWSDPRRWLPEAHRLLKPDGMLIFFTTGAMMTACTPEDGDQPGRTLMRDYFECYRTEFGADNGVEFHPTHSEWIRQLRACGFSLEGLIEVRPPTGAKPRYDVVDIEWARRWPSEEIWIARKTRPPLTEVD